MADNKVSEAYVEIGAKMDKLDKDLARTEKKVEDGFVKVGKKAGDGLESPIIAAIHKIDGTLTRIEKTLADSFELASKKAGESMESNIGAATDAIEQDIKATEAKITDGIGEAGKEAAKALETPVVDALDNIDDAVDRAERKIGDGANKAGKKVEDEFAKSGKKAANVLESPIVAAALKATAAFGALELGVGGVNVAIDAMTGDIEGAAEAVKRLPAGIGPFATQLEGLLGTVTGLKAATEAWAAATESSLQALNAQLDAADRSIANSRSIYDQEIDTLKQIEALRLKGLDDEDEKLMRLEANAAAAKRVLDIERQIENLQQQNARQSAVGSQDATDRASRIAEIKDELEGIDRAFRQNPLLEIEFLAGPKQEKASALQVELSNLQKLQDLRSQELQGRRRKIEQLEELMQKVTELNVLEDKQVEKDIQSANDSRIAESIKARTEAEQQVQDMMNKAREERQREDKAASDRIRHDQEQEKADEAMPRERERQQQEDMRMQLQIEGTEAIVRQAGQSRQLRPGDKGFGSTAGTKQFDRPQKIEAKVLDDIKAILERQVVAGDAFA